MDDYKIQMQDSTGRTCWLCINGDSVNDYVSCGYSEDHAQEIVENNAFEKAIDQGEIGADASRLN